MVEIFSQDVILHPTKGFNEFVFGVSEAHKVHPNFKNIEFEEIIGGSLSCGDTDPMRHESLTLINDSLGVRLYFSSSWLENSKRKIPCLYRIVLTKNVGIFVDSKVEIGKSNLRSVQNVYGEEKGRNRVKHALLYEKLGLYFMFDVKGILTRVQIKQVEVK